MPATSEEIREGLSTLFENFWIIRETDKDAYHQLLRIENDLKRVIQRNFGLRLIVHAKFIKLEKIPFESQDWMGITTFNEPMDYALFACAMAYTEDKSEGEAFLINELVDELDLFYPERDLLDWTNFNHRKSLVRVLNVMTDMQLIDTIEGKTDDFATSESIEVLYKVSPYSKYFMRSYPEDITQFQDWRELMQMERERADEETSTVAFRRLMMEPAILRTEENDRLFYYLRNQQQYITAFFEKNTPYTFELTKDVAMLTLEERLKQQTYFPMLKSADESLLQLAELVRGSEYAADAYGCIHLSKNQWLALIGQHATQNRKGWSKEYRESADKKLARLMLENGSKWRFFTEDGDGNVTILPTFARNTGKYPQDFLHKLLEQDDLPEEEFDGDEGDSSEQNE